MTTLETLQAQLERHRARAFLQSISDNYYYTSGRQAEDLRITLELEKAIKEEQEK